MFWILLQHVLDQISGLGRKVRRELVVCSGNLVQSILNGVALKGRLAREEGDKEAAQ